MISSVYVVGISIWTGKRIRVENDRMKYEAACFSLSVQLDLCLVTFELPRVLCEGNQLDPIPDRTVQ